MSRRYHATRLQPIGSSPKKRRLDENMEEFEKENRVIPTSNCRRSFIKIPAGEHVYHSEEWKEKQTTLYMPLAEDIMLNLSRIEQVSFGAGSCFVADHTDNYCGSKEGHTLHLWRYSEQSRKLFISRTFLFTDMEVYAFIRRQLEEV